MSYTLKEVRTELGLTQDVIIERTGLSVGAISALEKKNVVPMQATCKKLAKAYGIPSYVIRTIAVLSSEERPGAGPQRERYDEMVRLCMEAVSQKINGRKK